MLISWIVTPTGEGWTDIEPGAVVWIDVAKLEAAISMDPSLYVGRSGAGAGQKSRYDNVGKRILSGGPVWMPHLAFEGGRVSFTDGRHRFAWVRDHGASAIPVSVSSERAAELAARFGTPLRACHVELPTLA